MKLAKTLRALALAAAALGLSAYGGAASATTYNTFNLGTVPTAPGVVFGGDLLRGSFVDTYNFSLGSDGTLSGSAASLELKLGPLDILHIGGLGMSLYDAANALVGSWSGTPVSFERVLEAGSYHLQISGNGDGLGGGAYGFAMSALPVPEPSSATLLLAGLGLIGAIALRGGRRQRQV